ncbi:MAG: glycine zipper domain-containing protein [Pseudomonadota bacterium]
MRKFALTAAFLALIAAPQASAQVINCGQDNRAAGAVVGALVGGAAGGIIANNVERDVFVGRRGFRGHRGFYGHRGYYGRGFRRGRFVTRRGNQELGIVLGALAGGIIGNQIAAQNANPCPTFVSPSQRFGDPFARPLQGAPTQHTAHVVADGPIDLNAVKFGDPFGGRPVVRTPIQAQEPIDTRQRDDLAGGVQNLPQGVFEPQCQTVFQNTELPDGGTIRQPVEVCQYSEGGEWIPTG